MVTQVHRYRSPFTFLLTNFGPLKMLGSEQSLSPSYHPSRHLSSRLMSCPSSRMTCSMAARASEKSPWFPFTEKVLLSLI